MRNGKYQGIVYFEGEAISSDGGLLLPRPLRQRIGTPAAVADALSGRELCSDSRERAGKNGY